MGNTKAYTGIGWVRFKHNLSLKFVEMKMRAQSFLKEKEDEREKLDKSYFAQIRETKHVTRNCFVDKYKS